MFKIRLVLANPCPVLCEGSHDALLRRFRAGGRCAIGHFEAARLVHLLRPAPASLGGVAFHRPRLALGAQRITAFLRLALLVGVVFPIGHLRIGNSAGHIETKFNIIARFHGFLK